MTCIIDRQEKILASVTTRCQSRLSWLFGALDLYHSQLASDDVQRWLSLMKQNDECFCCLASTGFALRRFRDCNYVPVADADLEDFLWEFKVKIIWAAQRVMQKTGLPLFEVINDPVLAAACKHLELFHS